MCYVQDKPCLVIKQHKFGLYTWFNVPLLIQCVKSIDKKNSPTKLGSVRWFSCPCPFREMMFGVNFLGLTNYSGIEDLLNCKVPI
jgi:hypothetical protein